jgi:hypothetical protein
MPASLDFRQPGEGRQKLSVVMGGRENVTLSVIVFID